MNETLKLRLRFKDGHAVVDVGDLVIDGIHKARVICDPPDYRPRLTLEITEFLCELDTEDMR